MRVSADTTGRRARGWRTPLSAFMALLLLTGLLASAAFGAVTFEQATTNMTNPTSGSAATSLSIAKPAGVVEGEFLLAHITYEKGSDAGTSASFTPAGWTLLNRRNQSTDLGQAIFYKFAGASEPASYSFPFSQEVKAAGAILRYSGVHPTSPIVASSNNSGASGTLTATGVTAEADSVAVALFGVKKNTTLSVPSGYTSRVDFANPQDVKIRTVDRYFATAVATGDATSTPGSGDKWVAHLVVLRQADPPPPSNNAPVYTAAADQTADTGVEKAIDVGSFTDMDSHASWAVTVNWGDGTAEDTFSVTATGDVGTRNHTYATDGEKTVTVTVSDGTDTDSDTFKVTVTDPDVDPPVITFDATGDYAPNGSNGWWNVGTAKVKVTATDDSGVESLECTLDGAAVALTNTGDNATQRWGDVEMTNDGIAEVSCTAEDGEGNATEEGNESTHTLKRDTVAPVVTVTGVEDEATYTIGDVPAAGCDTTDTGGSGVATAASLESPEPDHDTAGSKTAICSGAVDEAGNGQASAVSVTYTVDAASVCDTTSSGFLPPIKDGARNIVKLGNVIPAKVSLVDCNGAPVQGRQLTVRYASGVADPNDVSEGNTSVVTSVSSADTGNVMRWADGQYIYNLATKNLTGGFDYTIVVRDTTGGVAWNAAPIVATAVIQPKK